MPFLQLAQPRARPVVARPRQPGLDDSLGASHTSTAANADKFLARLDLLFMEGLILTPAAADTFTGQVLEFLREPRILKYGKSAMSVGLPYLVPAGAAGPGGAPAGTAGPGGAPAGTVRAAVCGLGAVPSGRLKESDGALGSIISLTATPWFHVTCR